MKILIVDDDATLAELLQVLLGEDEGLVVDTATTELQALSILEHSPIDLVISDFVMPGSSGSGFLRKLHERRPQLPLILMSGYEWEDLESRDNYSYLSGFWHKGRPINELLGLVKDTLASH